MNPLNKYIAFFAESISTALLSLFLCPLTALSVSEKPLSVFLMNRWDVDTGLPAHEVHALLQTHNGFLWIGSSEGLFRFDGVRFVSYDRSRFPQLRSSRINTLFEDSKQRLWIGTAGGGISVISGDSLRTITSQQGLGSDYVRAIVEDQHGVIWVGTDGEGITAIKPDTLVTYGMENSILDRRVTSLFVDRENTLWIGTYNGLYSFDRDRFARIGRREGLPCDTVLSLCGRDDGLWVGTYGGGLVRTREGKFDTFDRGSGLPGTIVTSIAEDRNGDLWFTTLRGGICRLKNGRFDFRLLGEPEKGEFSVALVCDRENNIWVGLSNGGLVRLREPLFTWSSFGSRGTSAMVNSVVEDHHGMLWAGTTDGLKQLRGNEIVDPPSDETLKGNVLAVTEDKGGVIWVGTWNHGLYRLEGARFARVRLTGASTVWALYPDSDGATWIGTTGGLYRILDGRILRFTHNNSGLSHDDVRAITRTADGTLWVGTSYGLNELRKDTFRVFTTRGSGLPNDVIIALCAGSNGDLWIGTQGGIARARSDSVVGFTIRDGLPGDGAGQILEDDQGFLWIVSDRGLYRVGTPSLNQVAAGKMKRLHVTMFGKEDGLLRTNLSGTLQPAAWKSHDGRLWFGADRGVAMIDPGAIRRDTLEPVVVIDNVKVEGNTLPLRSIYEVGYDSGEFEFTYTAPSFVKQDKISFRYLLEGLDSRWVEAGNRRTAYYSKVPPGSYTFRVIAGNHDGAWSSGEASFVLTILPPVWMTWWFRSLLVITFLSLGPAIYFRRVGRLKRAHAAQQEVATRLITSQESERKRIAAELHDGLGQNLIIMKNRALLGMQSSEDLQLVREQLGEIAKTASSTLDDVRRIAHNLRPIHLERFGLTDSIRSTIEGMAATASIAFHSEIDDIDGALTKDEEIHFYRIVQEATNNVLKHSGASSATIRIAKTGRGIMCTVLDDGTGFIPEETRGGLGLTDIHERVKILGGTISVVSSPGMGTTLEVLVHVRTSDPHGT